MSTKNTQKSIFGGGQSDLDKMNSLLEEFNLATSKLPQVQTVQDIIVVTNTLSKLIQKTNKTNANSQIVFSK